MAILPFFLSGESLLQPQGISMNDSSSCGQPAEPRDKTSPVSTSDFSLRELIAQSKSGNRDAKDQLIAAHRDYLLLVANQMVGRPLRSKVAPSDLVQSACLQVHQHINDFQGSTQAELLAWLRTTLHNEVLQAQRKYQTNKRDLSREQSASALEARATGGDSQSPSAVAILNEEAEELRVAMLKLSADHRRAILLRNWERLPFEEIGQRMGRTTDAAKKLWSRALQQLRKHLQADPKDEPRRLRSGEDHVGIQR